MSDAPEKIWVDYPYMKSMEMTDWIDQRMHDTDTEYIRTDIAEAAKAAAYEAGIREGMEWAIAEVDEADSLELALYGTNRIVERIRAAIPKVTE
jgi:hypothetical protein